MKDGEGEDRGQRSDTAVPDQFSGARRRAAARIAHLAENRGIHIATAESLTGGLLASDLAQAPDASSWFRGGVVAYSPEVKRDVLCVRTGPVVSEHAVLDMADGVAALLGATATVAVSGVAGPTPLEGKDPGTVWIGVRHGSSAVAQLHHLTGEPQAICTKTCALALALLLRGLTAESADPAGDRRL